MTCDDFKHDLHLYYTGRLDPSRVDGLDEHRRTCPDCDRLMVVADELTCKDFTELLNDYVDGAMSSERRAVFDRHLAICSDCTAFLQSYRATMHMSALAMKQAMHDLSESMPDDLIDAVLEAWATGKDKAD